jgi:hypothetical protein
VKFVLDGAEVERDVLGVPQRLCPQLLHLRHRGSEPRLALEPAIGDLARPLDPVNDRLANYQQRGRVDRRQQSGPDPVLPVRERRSDVLVQGQRAGRPPHADRGRELLLASPARSA